jgi:nuclear pore complex protein Nup107
MPQTFLFKFLPAIFAFAYILNFFGQVNVSISSRDKYCIEVVLRCLSVVGDGIWPHELNDGGILATVMAAGFKGETI